jgi:adenylate cyclase
MAEGKTIKERIWHEFGATGAILVLDMSNFSRITQSHGIVFYLSMIQRMRSIVLPIIESFSGHVVKFEADNCFAYFYRVHNAIKAVVVINLIFLTQNHNPSHESDIIASCGIDFGTFLLIESMDFLGQTVNNACKLGEDLARAGEILIT